MSMSKIWKLPSLALTLHDLQRFVVLFDRLAALAVSKLIYHERTAAIKGGRVAVRAHAFGNCLPTPNAHGTREDCYLRREKAGTVIATFR
jgi:hypothetical protein